MLSFTLLGQVALSINGELLHRFRSQKELALLIYLAHTGQFHRRDFIAELLWESASASQALSNVRTALARLQRQVGDALLVTHRSLGIAPEHRQQVDSVFLLQQLAAIGPVASIETATALEQALGAYRGDFLGDFHLRNAPRFDEWAMATRAYIQHQVIAAYHRLGTYVQSAGHIERGIAVAQRWLQADELDESAHTLLIRMLIEAGKTHEAVAHYNQCAGLLHTELGIEPSPELTALIKNIQPKRAHITHALTTTRHNLPAAYDQFFGRRAIQQGLHMRLDQPWCRLVTLVGPGGVGKTRLATTVARQRLAHYADGVWLVELADLDPNDDNLVEAIAVEIAAALDLRFTGTVTPAKQLLDYLQHKHILLILDNFEHVIGGSQLVLDIVRRCEHVQLLVTSREALQLRAEWAIGLSGLSYPSSDMDITPTEAVELFVERRAQQPGILSGDDMAAIRMICRMVEGLPLAIELAAALARHTSPRSVAERLQDGCDALTTSLRDMPQRHQSLQIMFEMSWRTLTPILQQRLARLAVFRGGSTAAAAQQVAEADDQHLTALCEKSLLSHNAGSGRYTLHPVIHAYAAAKCPASDTAPKHHAQYFLGMLAKHTEPLQQHSPQDSMALLEPDIDNLRLAWQTGITQRHTDWLLAALAPLSIYYQLRGLAREGEAMMRTTTEAAISWNADGAVLATRASVERARFQNRLGQYWPAMQTAQAALKLATTSADRWAEGMVYVVWAEALWRLGKYETARSKLADAMAIATSINSTQIVGWCHHHLGIISDIQGHYAAAHEQLQHACAAWRNQGNATMLSVSMNSLGLVCHHQGNLAAAQQYMAQALTLCEQIDNRHLQAPLVNNLSMVATEQGDYQSAQNYLQAGLELATASGNVTGQAEIYNNLGRIAFLQGEYNAAVEYQEQALQLAEMLGNRSLIAIAMFHLARAKGKIGDEQRAESLYYQALYIAQQDNLQHLKCELSISLAELLIKTDPYQARQQSAEAITLATSIGNPQLIERANMIAHKVGVSAERNEKNLSA